MHVPRPCSYPAFMDDAVMTCIITVNYHGDDGTAKDFLVSQIGSNNYIVMRNCRVVLL